MKRISLYVFLFMLLTCVYGFKVDITGDLNQPVFSTHSQFKTGFGLSLALPFYEGDNYRVKGVFNYNIFKGKNFENIKFTLTGLSPTIEFNIFSTFNYNLYGNAGINILSEELSLEETDIKHGGLYFGFSAYLNLEYLWADKMNLLLKPGIFVTDSLYYFFVKGGVQLDI